MNWKVPSMIIYPPFTSQNVNRSDRTDGAVPGSYIYVS